MWNSRKAAMILENFRTALASEINPDIRCDANTRPSSVLIVIYGDDPKILMTKKSSHLKIHAGEIAFPGGKADSGDADLLHTALRESREELSLALSKSQVVGQLDPVRTLNSNFTIIPFVSVLDSLPELRHNREVEQVLQIPAEAFLQTLQSDPDPRHSLTREMYTLAFREHLIWGASAMMLKQIADKLSAHDFL